MARILGRKDDIDTHRHRFPSPYFSSDTDGAPGAITRVLFVRPLFISHSRERMISTCVALGSPQAHSTRTRTDKCTATTVFSSNVRALPRLASPSSRVSVLLSTPSASPHRPMMVNASTWRQARLRFALAHPLCPRFASATTSMTQPTATLSSPALALHASLAVSPLAVRPRGSRKRP